MDWGQIDRIWCGRSVALSKLPATTSASHEHRRFRLTTLARNLSWISCLCISGRQRNARCLPSRQQSTGTSLQPGRTMAVRYTHEPLPFGTDYIRLVPLLPGSFDIGIAVRLHTISLSKSEDQPSPRSRTFGDLRLIWPTCMSFSTAPTEDFSHVTLTSRRTYTKL